jgi:NAD+ diphosphatase
MDFIPGIRPEKGFCRPGFLFVFKNGRVLIRNKEEKNDVIFPNEVELEKAGIKLIKKQFIGSLKYHACYAATINGTATLPEEFTFKPLRSLLTVLDENLIWAAGRANQLIHWEMTHNFCGACGAPFADKPDEHAKICSGCGLVNYPRVTPAVIMAVIKEDKILLARNSQARMPFYSVLAGFVEPSESLEDCVCREVKEEVGISVKNIRYFGSQPWPFPDSLMIGFIAEHASGDIRIDHQELSDAAWFDYNSLPRVPPPLSIAGQLIEWFVRNHKGD